MFVRLCGRTSNMKSHNEPSIIHCCSKQQQYHWNTFMIWEPFYTTIWLINNAYFVAKITPNDLYRKNDIFWALYLQHEWTNAHKAEPRKSCKWVPNNFISFHWFTCKDWEHSYCFLSAFILKPSEISVVSIKLFYERTSDHNNNKSLRATYLVGSLYS